MVTGEHVNKIPNTTEYGRHRIPKRQHYCQYCKAIMWYDERLSLSSARNTKFGYCCLQGQVDLPVTNEIPQEIFDLLTLNTSEGKQFRSSIRLYNSILAFKYISAKIDESLMAATNGVYTYRINGDVHHKLSSYMPNTNHSPKFSQIYIYDVDMQSSIRTGMYPKVIKASILNKIQRLLELNNPFVRIYKQAGERLRNDPSSELNIVIKANDKTDRTKNKPSVDEIAVLMVDDDQTIDKRDIIVNKRNDESNSQLIYVNESLHMYDPLAYPLMHIFGESGWQYNMYPKRPKDILIYQHCAINNLPPMNLSIDSNLNQNNLGISDLPIANITAASVVETSRTKYITAREYYAYRLQDRPSN